MTGKRAVEVWFRWVIALCVIASAVFAVAQSRSASAAFTPHPTLVPEVPVRGYPTVLGTPQYIESNQNCSNCVISREVYAADQVGDFIVAGGNFFEVELQNGTVLQQKYFAAWQINTKQIVCANQITFNGIVRAVEPGPTPTKVFVGGDFTSVSGANGVVLTRSKIVLIDLASCAVDPTFVSTGANARITETTLVGNRLFVGGDFTAIGGTNIRYVAELNATSGAVQPAFNLTFGTTTLSSKIRGMGATPDGTKLIFGGRFGSVAQGGVNLTTQTAIVDITNPVSPILTNHSFQQSHPEFPGRPYAQSFQDMSVSPDGTKIGLAYGTATVSDYVYLVNANPGPQVAVWSHYEGDSNFGVAVSNNAVYISGHFCRISPGPGPTQQMSPKFGFDLCTASGNASNVWRSHMAALSITDGTPLTWNPGADSFVGGRELTVTSRGLLVGYDGTRINDIRVGALGFLDFGSGPDITAPSNVTITAPIAGATVGSPVTVTGTATDNVGVVKYRVRFLATNGQWVQANGTLGTAAFEFKPLPQADGSLLVSVHMPVGTYQLEAKAVDSGLLSSPDWAKRLFTVVNLARRAAGRLEATIVVPQPIVLGSAVAINGSIITTDGIASVQVTVTNAAGLFLQDDLSFGEKPHSVIIVPGLTQPDGTVPWSVNLGSTLPLDSYAITVDVTDLTGNTATQSATFVVQNAIVAPVEQAHAVLLDYAGFTPQAIAVDQTVGYAFTVGGAVSVTDLGIFDTNLDGILNNPAAASIGLWSQADQQQLAVASVVVETKAEQGWFYATLTKPVMLQPGVVYVVGYQTFAQGEPVATGGAIADSTVIHITSNASVGGAFGYPNVQTNDVFGIGMPNMKVTAPPQP
jgi:hypothetical protein